MITSSVVVDNFHYIHKRSVHHCLMIFFLFYWDFSFSGIYRMNPTLVEIDNFHYVYQKPLYHCIVTFFIFSDTSVIVKSTVRWSHQSLLLVFIISIKNLSIIALWASLYFSKTSVIVESTVWWRHLSMLKIFIMPIKNLFLFALWASFFFWRLQF